MYSAHILCDFLCKVLLSLSLWLFVCFTVETLHFNFLCPCNFLSFCMCACVQTLGAGCNYLASSFIMLSQASRSLKWAKWNKHTNWWRPRPRHRTGTPAKWAFHHIKPQSTGSFQVLIMSPCSFSVFFFIYIYIFIHFIPWYKPNICKKKCILLFSLSEQQYFWWFILNLGSYKYWKRIQ